MFENHCPGAQTRDKPQGKSQYEYVLGGLLKLVNTLGLSRVTLLMFPPAFLARSWDEMILVYLAHHSLASTEKSGAVVDTCNPRTREAEIGRSLRLVASQSS